MMKKVIKLSASILATVVLSLACGHGTAAMNRAAAVSEFSPSNSALPMSTSTASGIPEFGSAAASSGLNKAAISSSSSAMSSNSSVAGSTHVSDNSGNNANSSNNSGKSSSSSGTVTRSGDSGKTNNGSGTTASPKGSGSAGVKSTATPAAPAKPSGDTPPAPAPKAPAAPAVTPYNISADQQAIIAYGRSKGLIYNSNLRPENTTWRGRTDLLLDVGSDSDIIRGAEDEIDGMIRVGYAGADFYPYFEKKSNKTNDYYSYVLWG